MAKRVFVGEEIDAPFVIHAVFAQAGNHLTSVDGQHRIEPLEHRGLERPASPSPVEAQAERGEQGEQQRRRLRHGVIAQRRFR